jgi:hypothetical protein
VCIAVVKKIETCAAVLALLSFQGDGVRHLRLVLIVEVCRGIEPVLEQAVDLVDIEIDDQAAGSGLDSAIAAGTTQRCTVP